MNSIRQFFTLRSLAAFRQNVSPNPLAADDDEDRRRERKWTASLQTHQHQEKRGFLNYSSNEYRFQNPFPALTNVGNSTSALSSSSNSSISSFGIPSTTLNLHSETLKIGYLCKVCQKRSSKRVSKEAYKHGVVIIACPGCSTNHLIIDNVGWFKNTKKGFKNIEDVIAANTGHVTKIVIDEHGGIIQHA
ncbi:hypothetical protein ACFFRR_009345 [Megaselia abdita]